MKADDSQCPHCGASRRTTTGARAGAVLMGLALAGCPAGDDATDDGITVAQPAYGVPDTEGDPPDETTTTGGTGGETDTATSTSADGTGSTGDSGSGSDTGATAGSDSVGEPEYGVPETTSR